MLIFGHYISRQKLLLSFCDALLFMLVFVVVGIVLSADGLAAADLHLMLPGILVSSLLLLLSLAVFGAYEVKARRSPRASIGRLVPGGAVGSVAILLAQPVLIQSRISGWAVVAAVALACLSALITRAVTWDRAALSARLRPKAFVLGTGDRAAAVWQACGDDRYTRMVRFFHPDLTAGAAPADGLPIDRLKPLPATIISLARQDGVKEIVVALDERRGTLPLGALLECRTQGIRILDSASFLERETGRVDVGAIYPSWLVFSGGFRYSLTSTATKWLLDFAGSALLLVLTTPLMLVVSLAIKLDSPGAIFYSQERVGRHGRIFRILKFRSMVKDAEVHGQAVWASRRDPRITRVGRVIRRCRLDEIPQLVNVLRGEMSLVGPRPERPPFVETLAQQIPFYAERHQVKPGITGWAQINYAYADSIEDSRVKLEYDLYYVKNYSLFLDLVILTQTIRIVFFGEGAR